MGLGLASKRIYNEAKKCYIFNFRTMPFLSICFKTLENKDVTGPVTLIHCSQ
jgi:hypothetical protein